MSASEWVVPMNRQTSEPTRLDSPLSGNSACDHRVWPRGMATRQRWPGWCVVASAALLLLGLSSVATARMVAATPPPVAPAPSATLTSAQAAPAAPQDTTLRDIAALAGALAWPLVVGLVFVAYRHRIDPLLGSVVGRIKSFSVGAWWRWT
jgi:hypothetical protein